MNKDAAALAYFYFDAMLTPTQAKIVRAIMFKEHKRIVIAAHTRFGKSFSVAIGLLLYIIFNENKKVALIAPTNSQASIVRNEMAKWMMNSDFMSNLLELEYSSGIDRLKKEVSKNRWTFKNGCEVRILSAEGKGERLMGFGADAIVEDESALIKYDVYRSKISRMLGDNPNSMLIEIGNPWHRDNQMWEHWTNPNFHKIHIPASVGLAEGRISEIFLNEQRTELTGLEFDILWNAEFPTDTEDQLFRWSWIQEAIDKPFPDFKPVKVQWGLDVGEFGRDLSVLTRVEIDEDNRYNVTDIYSWGYCDTMQTVARVRELVPFADPIHVDAHGVGSGVHARLKELGYRAVDVKVGRGTESHTKTLTKDKKERFLNQKAEFYFHLRHLFEDGIISIPQHKTLVSELTKIKWERSSSERIRIIDPKNSTSKTDFMDDKSPDFADSLLLACCRPRTTELAIGFMKPKEVFKQQKDLAGGKSSSKFY